MHAFHAAKLGRLECKLCHTSVAKGSVELKPPGHDQCKLCHAADFAKLAGTGSAICLQCHGRSSVQTPSRTVLAAFSHRLHIDAKARTNALSGFRADCTHCHGLDKTTEHAAMPSHTQCAACHAKPGFRPELTPFLRTAGCRGCHNPEALESSPPRGIAGYPAIRFSHLAHFRVKQQSRMDCTTCHVSTAQSTGLADTSLPKMEDCNRCHNTSRKPPAAFGISNCAGCHLDARNPARMLSNFTQGAKPAFHTGTFRMHHEAAASSSEAKCYACHENVRASSREQCVSCHQTMRPTSHTARWKDDIHGKYAALERRTCATCHTTDYCSRCHNELPNSHLPLPVFKNGGHANLAMLNERSCLTCHTFQNTCSSCHARQLVPGKIPH